MKLLINHWKKDEKTYQCTETLNREIRSTTITQTKDCVIIDIYEE